MTDQERKAIRLRNKALAGRVPVKHEHTMPGAPRLSQPRLPQIKAVRPRRESE